MHRAHSAARLPDLIRVRPRPFTGYISRGRSVLATALDGSVTASDHGFYVHETRLLSRWRHLIDGEHPEATAMSNVSQNVSLAYFVCAAPGVTRPPRDDGSGLVAAASQITLETKITRCVDDGLHEDVDITNFTMERTSFVLAIEVDGDFADHAETEERQQQGTREITWRDSSLRLDYAVSRNAITLRRGADIRVAKSTSDPEYRDGRIEFRVTLEPGARWHACIAVDARIDGTVMPAPEDCYGAPTKRDLAIERWIDEGTQFESEGSSTRTADVIATLVQARSDLASLRLFDLDRGENAWTVAAGLPIYVSLFGRDTLTTGWQAGIVGPEIMSGTLGVLASLQGSEENDWRDEQPGKMLHEAHTGPLAMLEINPRRRSYSSITTSGLYAFIAAELWHWTGDKSLVRQYVEPALRGLRWLEQYGDPDGDGFYEYRTRSPKGPRHHAWKDSPDAIVYDDGRLVEPPIATSEEQAFVYIAKLHFAEMLWVLGERELSRRIYRESVELKKRFNERFWIEEDGFYAMALDAEKQPVRSIGSNAGHCIAAAIVDNALVERTADRLFEPDLFSGWGIRTLSSDHPRYNPYSYHLGSIWPVEQGTFALGFMRYGLFDRVEQIARSMFDAAAVFEFHRLPELFGGHPRDEQHPFPGLYPGANSPQAWSASSVFALLQAMLGLYPYAPLKLLVVDPHLPEWLPAITLRDLRVGKARVTIQFKRRADGRTSYRVLDMKGKLHVVRQATPWSLTAGPAERLRDALASLLPRH